MNDIDEQDGVAGSQEGGSAPGDDCAGASVGSTARSGGSAALLTGLLLWAVVGHSVATYGLRFSPHLLAETLVIGLLVLAWLIQGPVRRPAPLALAWLGGAVLLIGWWQLRSLMQEQPIGVAWGRSGAQMGAVLAAWLALTLPVAPRELLRLAAAAAAASLAVALVDCWREGLWNEGLGNVNYLIHSVTPLLAAGIWIAWDERRAGPGQGRRSERLLLALGVVCWLIFVIGSGRRGAVLSAALIAGGLLWRWAWPGHRRIAYGLLAGGGGLMVAAVAVLALIPRGGGRATRMWMYLAGGEVIGEALPWGFGQYGALFVNDGQGSWARYLAADGRKMADAHNELLDLALDGGLPGLVLGCLLLAAVAWLLWQGLRRRHDVAVPLLLAALALLAPLLLDNSLSMGVPMLVVGLLAGLMLRSAAGPASGLSSEPAPARRRWQLAGALCAVPALALVVHHAPIVMRSRLTADPAELIAPMRRCHDLMTVEQHGFTALDALLHGQRTVEARELFDILQAALGANQHVRRRALLLAVQEDEPEVALGHLVRLLRDEPFDRQLYQTCLGLELPRETVMAALGQRLATRLSYMTGNPRLPVPDTTLPITDIDVAADLYAAVIWHIANRDRPRRGWAAVDPALERLTIHYGSIPALGHFVAQAHIEAGGEGAPFAWIADHRVTLASGARRHPGLTELLESVANPGELAAALDLVVHLRGLQEIHERWRLGQAIVPLDARPAQIDRAVAVARLLGAARYHGLLDEEGLLLQP